ncbi:hypothetical protein B9Z55_008650 [Caenorhabditis nigoni]|nr:hypothetical protein B9Z55_008650 [Caenorhabditis nigoni]
MHGIRLFDREIQVKPRNNTRQEENYRRQRSEIDSLHREVEEGRIESNRRRSGGDRRDRRSGEWNSRDSRDSWDSRDSRSGRWVLKWLKWLKNHEKTPKIYEKLSKILENPIFDP